ncbi:GntR family transcriptional regulator [Paraglaciecola arctica]|uniref:GntR family transcriptional regulator n=1 Tax=Paraglaciecola arctica BSs20135 TaxID=493475 RepID=K6YRU3_9ALTE|nr:GntR family transcriptional regulator [Paraglaciecola arctica]GAC19393.1 GntR family transcriptional regulator [Paraglaciecola arctica BSs20135]
MINFILDPKNGVPLYRQIINQIRFGIASGQLKSGEQLPTVRALAVELKINLNTIAKAYKELEIQSVLESQQGTGTFISSTKVELNHDERAKKLTDTCSEFLSVTNAYGFSHKEIIEKLKMMKP